jgi:hypothetical protein
MALTKIIVLCISAFVLLISAFTLIVLPTPSEKDDAGANLLDAELDNLTIVHVGGGTLASRLVDRLEESGARVFGSADIPEAIEFNSEVVIIFGGEWFEGRVYDTELHDFLRLASSRGASLAMLGGATSKFFEALDRAGVHEIPVTETGEVRNPAYFNPPLVGFRMKTADGYTFPSLLFGCGSISDFDPAESLIGWLPSTTSTCEF